MSIARAVLSPFIFVGRTAVKIAVAELVIGAGVGAFYGAVANLASDQTALQSGKSMFNGTRDLVVNAVDGWFRGDTDPSTLKWGHAVKWAAWPVTASAGFVGGFAGNGGMSLGKEVVKVAWNLVDHAVSKIPDVKSSSAPVTVPASKPHSPQARTKISYRVDHSRLG